MSTRFRQALSFWSTMRWCVVAPLLVAGGLWGVASAQQTPTRAQAAGDLYDCNPGHAGSLDWTPTIGEVWAPFSLAEPEARQKAISDMVHARLGPRSSEARSQGDA